MIFVDSNIPMYLVGTQHPHKIDAQRLLERCISDNERLVTDAEVLQEILHRYVEIDRKEAIMPALQVVLDLVDEVFPIERRDVERAKESCSLLNDFRQGMPSILPSWKDIR